jgi:hypothetical protein
MINKTQRPKKETAAGQMPGGGVSSYGTREEVALRALPLCEP